MKSAVIFALTALTLSAGLLSGHGDVRAQSADLVLCDRIAADPADPDKPANVRGVSEVAEGDIETAIRFCKAASAGSRRALYQLGRAQLAARQYPDAMATFRRAADKGSTSAMVELGVMYGTGTGVAKNPDEARKLFQRAAEAGNPRGVANLAAVSGSGVAADPVRARALLAKAADANSAEAQYQLGLMMAEGSGGPKDDVGARALFQKAAAQNHPGALAAMGDFAMQGRGGPEDSTVAKSYYERAAALGNEDAKAALKRAECPYRIKDKNGKFVSNLCF
jgi:TPR repeat protein